MRIITTLLSLLSVTTLGFGLGACAKDNASCEALASRLCETNAEQCTAARNWVDTQGAGDDAARGEACAQMLKDPRALSAYVQRFAEANRPIQVAPTPTPRPSAGGAPAQTPPAGKPTTRDEIRTFGENVEEIGNVGEKAGEAMEKIGDIFKGKNDTTP